MFSEKGSQFCYQPPGHGNRFVDDTWVIQKRHINKNSWTTSITWTQQFSLQWKESSKWCHSILDTLVTPLADNSLSFQVYQKPTHTDQYLQWDSHHSLSSKYSVIGTLTHRVKVVCTNSVLLQGELSHLRRAQGKCNYPSWAIKRVQQKV